MNKLISNQVLASIIDSCSIGCSFCFRADRGSNYIMPNTFSIALSRLHEIGVRNICLTGGEPTEHPMLEDLVKLAIGFGFSVSMISSTRSVCGINCLKSIQKYLTHLNFSADSYHTSKFSNANRDLNSAGKIINSLDNIPITLNIVSYNLSESEVISIDNFSKTHDVQVTFSPLVLSEKQLSVLNVDQRIYNKIISRDKDIIFEYSNSDTIKYLRLTSRKKCLCSSPRLYLSSKGELSFCPYSKNRVSVNTKRLLLKDTILEMNNSRGSFLDKCTNICGELK
ncbi:TPA: radical SAM protein [Vibrio parahaemolyticus]|uniref:radical SAM protein n=1 Tax=Vibrio parahaemolyticus TaxID=670 RepID=UPI0022B3DAF6|nr:radical SAM protein [Vibrio parahaemolyticus]ELB1989225.1 radical SAM protein [Vibrio parahaemolyticus]MCZ6311100.1 radical SAM protein [Vibrio parahaemolyticus]HBN6178897.1 radical SAM protein [Vibrio parahaemolyticus]HBN6318074.1 radical SAM protein [Vibrio parahaemolyticus]HCD5130801.1 radical SAM protein [Vibrio parahaemolyticus]